MVGAYAQDLGPLAWKVAPTEDTLDKLTEDCMSEPGTDAPWPFIIIIGVVLAIFSVGFVLIRKEHKRAIRRLWIGLFIYLSAFVAITSFQPDLLLFLPRFLRHVLIAIYLISAGSSLVVGVLFMQRYVWVYRIQDRLLKIKIFGVFTLHRIWWREIEDVKIVPVDQFLWAYKIPGYEFSRKRVLIRLRKGLIRNVLLSPKDPEKFVEEIQERVKQGRAKL